MNPSTLAYVALCMQVCSLPCVVEVGGDMMCLLTSRCPHLSFNESGNERDLVLNPLDDMKGVFL